jgi:hypothetical protein
MRKGTRLRISEDVFSPVVRTISQQFEPICSQKEAFLLVDSAGLLVEGARNQFVLIFLSAVSEAPREATVRSCMFSGEALRVQH